MRYRRINIRKQRHNKTAPTDGMILSSRAFSEMYETGIRVESSNGYNFLTKCRENSAVFSRTNISLMNRWRDRKAVGRLLRVLLRVTIER